MEKLGQNGEESDRKIGLFIYSIKDSINPCWAPTLWQDRSMPREYTAVKVIFKLLLSWSLLVGGTIRLE